MKIGVHCESCLSENCKVLESRPIGAASEKIRRRRWACFSCGNRWTVYTNASGAVCKKPPHRPYQNSPKSGKRSLSNEAIFEILSKPEIPNRLLVEKYLVSRDTIRLIRIGSIYKVVHPNLERKTPRLSNKPSCRRCVHWRNYCSMDIPDVEVEGPGFASDCLFYEPFEALSTRPS